MKRLLFFTHHLIGGGAEKTIINLAEYINKTYSSYEAYICVVYTDSKVANELQSKVIVLESKTTPDMSKIRKVPIILKQVQELRKVKRDLNIDTCLSFLPGADLLNVLSKGKEKIIVSVRNKESFFVNSIFRKKYIQFCYKKADKIVAISKSVEADVNGFFGIPKEKIVTIYNPNADFEIGDNVTDSFRKLVDEKKVLITAGRLTKQKGQGYLIRAFSLVHDRMPDVHLVILGRGELEEELKILVKKYNLEDAVTFQGFVYNPYDYIAKADLFVFSSIVEGLGNVLVETLKCGTPIVSSDCACGPREILAPDTDILHNTDKIEYAEYGVLTPVCTCDYFADDISEQEEMMAEAIIHVLSTSELAMKYQTNSAERIRDFNIDKIAAEWMKLV